MGFHLSNLISYGTGNRAAAAQDASGVPNSTQIQHDKGMAALKSMTPGETLQGEVVSVNGNEVEIKIDENAVISAKLERNVGVAAGQTLMFEVSGSSDGQISLRALFTNLAQEQLAQNALQTAGIPQNGRSIQMIAGLMQEGMSIDKQSLQSVYHDIVQFPDTEQSLLLHMHKIGMETTPQNVEQFQALVNYEERVANTINELIRELPAELKNMIANGETNSIMTVTGELFQLIAEQEGSISSAVSEEPVLQSGQDAVVQNASGTVLEGASLAEGGTFVEQFIPDMQNEAEGKMINPSMQPVNMTEENMSSEETNPNVINKALAALEEAMNPQNRIHTLVDEIGNYMEHNTVQEGDGKLLAGVLTGPETEELANLLKNSGFSEETVRLVKEGNVPLNELFHNLKTELPGKEVKVVTDLWENKTFTKLMSRELQKAWLLNPSEVENGKNVSDFYNRLNTQVNSILSSMTQSLSESSVLTQSLQQFQENVDFLNNLNQFMPYVQLPLKMNGQSATGDLYVYADKRSLASGKDSVSAALHLDMQFLGHLDVFVKMQDKNVSTEFCLENESTLDFIAEHMDMLSERLERRGYHLTSEMKVTDTPSNLKEDILPAGDALSVTASGNDNTVGIYRFDVRA